ncbi:hypothetical protein AVEN_235114-1, partial [Araneus ventricosus]
RWEQLCSSLDYETPNSRLWKLAKALDRAQPQEENSNSITKSNGSLTIDDQEAAEELGKFYSNESRLTFGREDKKVGIMARNLVKTCRQVSTSNQVFSDYFTTSELMYAIQQMDNNKSPGPDGIHGKFLENIGPYGRERFLYIFNLSWKVVVLPKQ